MSNSYDIIIVGAGTMGMSAGYFLAKSGLRILMLDKWNPPHEMGSHHGDTRIIRFAYSDGDIYVPLVLRSYELWRQLEEESQIQTFEQTGTISIGNATSSLIHNCRTSAKQFALSTQMLDSDEIHQRWPGIIVPEDHVGCFEPSAGVLFSENCIRAYHKLSLEHALTTFVNASVQHIDMHNEGCVVHTESGKFYADKLVVCAGAWTGKLLADLNIPLQPIRKTIAWFDVDEAVYGHNNFPAFIFSDENRFFYGFPSFDGKGLKIGRHDSGQFIDPETINRDFGAFPEDEGDVRALLEKFMPQAVGKLNQGKVCMYTHTPDEHFIIDRHPEFSHIMIAAGFSGHGFKFASVVGEILSQLTLHNHSDHDISRFSLQRF